MTERLGENRRRRLRQTGRREVKWKVWKAAAQRGERGQLGQLYWVERRINNWGLILFEWRGKGRNEGCKAERSTDCFTLTQRSFSFLFLQDSNSKPWIIVHLFITGFFDSSMGIVQASVQSVPVLHCESAGEGKVRIKILLCDLHVH